MMQSQDTGMVEAKIIIMRSQLIDVNRAGAQRKTDVIGEKSYNERERQRESLLWFLSQSNSGVDSL